MTDTIAVDTTFGRIETFVDDLITNQLLQFGAHTRPELALLLSIIEPGDFVFDVGAHIGTFSAPVETSRADREGARNRGDASHFRRANPQHYRAGA
jgi:hypothetical protein